MSNEEFTGYTHWDLVRDMYFGKDSNNPPITMRVRDLENFQKNTEKWQEDLRSWFKALILFSLGQTCAIVGALIWYAVNKK